ncbi:MAG: zinc-binding dehydrogenase [Mycetocola sp.]
MVIETILCGVDGSEIHMFRGEFDWLNTRAPVIFGDEIIGRVSALGEGTGETRKLRIGDRVVIEARWTCGDCRTCNAGQYYLCERRPRSTGYGLMPCADVPHLMGGYATHVYVPEIALVHPVPEGMSDKTALIGCSPLANGVRWAGMGGTPAGAHTVVIGPGPQGLSCAVAASALGHEVTLVGLEADAARLAVAQEFGISSTYMIPSDAAVADIVQDISSSRGPVDLIIETAGAVPAKSLAFELIRPMGAVVNVSVPSQHIQPINWQRMMTHEVTIYNPLSHPHHVQKGMALAAQLLGNGLDVGDWITHVFGLSQVVESIATAAYETPERPVKVALDPSA